MPNHVRLPLCHGRAVPLAGSHGAGPRPSEQVTSGQGHLPTSHVTSQPCSACPTHVGLAYRTNAEWLPQRSSNPPIPLVHPIAHRSSSTVRCVGSALLRLPLSAIAGSSHHSYSTTCRSNRSSSVRSNLSTTTCSPPSTGAPSRCRRFGPFSELLCRLDPNPNLLWWHNSNALLNLQDPSRAHSDLTISRRRCIAAMHSEHLTFPSSPLFRMV
jgi:hypothetical protein